MEELELVLVHMIAEQSKLGEKNRDLSAERTSSMLERWVLDAVVSGVVEDHRQETAKEADTRSNALVRVSQGKVKDIQLAKQSDVVPYDQRHA